MTRGTELYFSLQQIGFYPKKSIVLLQSMARSIELTFYSVSQNDTKQQTVHCAIKCYIAPRFIVGLYPPWASS